MNRYQFEDLISEYIENELPLSKRREFEDYMKQNQDSREIVYSMKENIKALKKATRLKVSSSFDETLHKNVQTFKNNPQKIGDDKMVFGFTPKYATLLAGFVIAFVFISFKLSDPYFKGDKVDMRNLVNDQLNQESPSTALNNIENKDLVDAKEDSISKSIDDEKRKSFSKKIQFVND